MQTFNKLFSLLIESAQSTKPKMNAAKALHKWFVLKSQGKLTLEKSTQLEKIIATSAPTAVAHAITHLKTRFPVGEKTILNSSSRNIIQYGYFLLTQIFKVIPSTIPDLKTMNDRQLTSFYKKLIQAPTEQAVRNIINAKQEQIGSNIPNKFKPTASKPFYGPA